MGTVAVIEKENIIPNKTMVVKKRISYPHLFYKRLIFHRTSLKV